MELLEALQAARWPEACDAGLRAHVDGCENCSELALVAHNIAFDATATMREASIPSSGAMWWRIQRRARDEGARSAARTVAAVQIGSVVVVALIAIALLGGISAIQQGWQSFTMNIALPIPLIIVVAIACFTLAPVAVYYAITEE
jgi:hypothetical protein